MIKHAATITWVGGSEGFEHGRYSRVHQWAFSGGATITASASPTIVPPPYSAADAIDPEEAFVAAASSCHMLWFLDLARQAGLVVSTYEDRAVGTMEKNHAGKLSITQIDLFPVTQWVGAQPKFQMLEHLHNEAHHACFIANSMRSEITVHLAVKQA